MKVKFKYVPDNMEYIELDIEIGESYLCIKDDNPKSKFTKGMFYELISHDGNVLKFMGNNGLPYGILPEYVNIRFDLNEALMRRRNGKIDNVLGNEKR